MTAHAELEAPAGRAAVDGTTLAWIERGDGPLVLCLHGFPDSVWSWVPTLDALAAAGFRAVAPALRGYAPSGPAGRTTTVSRLAADVLGVADALGASTFSVVGHDWGAVTAWALDGLAPERLERLVVASVPHPSALVRNAGPTQLWRSRYMLQFQLPWLPERVLARDDLAWVRGLARRWSPTWHPSDAQLETVVAGLRGPGAVRAALGCYRGLPRDLGSAAERRLAFAPVTAPTAYVHGADDACIGVEVAAGQERAFRAGYEETVIAGAGHFVHLEDAEAFAAAAVAHLTGDP